MVVCATGAVVTGLRYWMDHWQQVKNDFDDGNCAIKNGNCICSSVESAMPSLRKCIFQRFDLSPRKQ